MMYSIEILAAFDFLGEETKVGTLEYERVKRGAAYRFSYEKAFLSAFPKVNLSADLGRYLGIQAASDHLFSFLGDALPDSGETITIEITDDSKRKTKKEILIPGF